MTTKIDTVTSRDKLKVRREPYWHRVSKGCFMGYRKMIAGSSGSWIARSLDEATGKQLYHALGGFSELPDNQRFDVAQKAAVEWFEHRRTGGNATTITVGQACMRYIQKQRDDKKVAATKDMEIRFKRWMFCDKKLSDTPLLKLTQGQIHDWRNKLTQGPAIPQDKKKESTKSRAASTINREVAVLRAALNLAMKDGYCTTNAAWHYKLLPIKNATGRRDCYLEPEQRRTLIASAQADLVPLLKALCLLPLRPGAIASLTAGSFDKRLKVLTVGKDKNGHDRKISLPPTTSEFFAEQVKDKLPTAPLISRDGGKSWDKDSWKYPFKDAVVKANLPKEATAYALRHSTITDLIVLHHLDILTVAQLSGTSVMMIEKHYGHLLREHAAHALGKLALN